MVDRAGYLGATRSISGSTADGAGESLSCPPVSAVAAQIVVGTGSTGQGTGSFRIEGSLDGSNWVTIIAASTFDGNRLVSTPGSSTEVIAPVTHLRAFLVSLSSTNDATVFVAARS